VCKIAAARPVGYHGKVRGVAFTVASLIAVAASPTARAAHWPRTKGSVHDTTKAIDSSELDEQPVKLPLMPKVKECCGYPIALKDGFRLSFYWLAYEEEYAREKYDTDIYDELGFWIGRYPSAFVYELKLEGTGFLRDGRLLNYSGPCDVGMGTCFSILDPKRHPMGRGVQNRALEAFRSVAVDPRLIPIGSTIWVPELQGIELPDGTKHDGCLRADDQGGAIKGGKLDFFVESYFNFKFLADQLWWHMRATPHLDEPRCAYLRVGEPRERQNELSEWADLRRKNIRVALTVKTKNRRGLKRGPTLTSAVAVKVKRPKR
jgi:3D (Asp-Asp-Asp) domain-containing protein